MHDVANDFLRKNVKLAGEGSGVIRIFEIQNGRSQKVFSGSEAVRDVQDSTELFAEVGSIFYIISRGISINIFFSYD